VEFLNEGRTPVIRENQPCSGTQRLNGDEKFLPSSGKKSQSEEGVLLRRIIAIAQASTKFLASDSENGGGTRHGRGGDAEEHAIKV